VQLLVGMAFYDGTVQLLVAMAFYEEACLLGFAPCSFSSRVPAALPAYTIRQIRLRLLKIVKLACEHVHDMVRS
jgi:hypothetical protein